MSEQTTKGHLALVGTVLAGVVDGNSPGYVSEVKAAISPLTETRAYARTEKHLAGYGRIGAVGARRAAAIAACASKASASASLRGDGLRIGHALRALHRAETGVDPGDKPNAITTSVGALPMLDVENAAQIIAGLVSRCDHRGIHVSFVDVASTLTYWGDGITESSRETRRRVVADYYRPPRPVSNDHPGTEPAA